MAVHCDIAVIGGGLGGLALCCGLKNRGWDCRLYEAAPELRTATSTLIALGNNAWTALNWLHPELVPRIKAAGYEAKERVGYIRTSKDSEWISQKGPPWSGTYIIRWSKVQRVLASLIPDDAVYCGYRLITYEEQEDHVRLKFKDKPDVTARFVVAADGIRSAIRATMIPEDPGPRYLGHMNWNALLYNPNQSVAGLLPPGWMKVFHNGPLGQWNIQVFVFDAGAGYNFWQVRIPSDQQSFTPNPDHADQPHADDQSKTYLVGGGMGKPGSKARLVKLLQDAGFDTEPLRAVQATPESDIFERAILDRIPLDELGHGMSSAGGRVVLLGDAAHGVHPGPGQGARMAFEDAHTLAQALVQQQQKLLQEGWTFGLSKLNAEANGNVGDSAVIENGDGCTEGGLQLAVSEYEAQRLTRTCRIQRFAAEGCGIQKIREAYKPPGVIKEETVPRIMALTRWLDMYPRHPTGNPDCPYWRWPLTSSVEACSRGVTGIKLEDSSKTPQRLNSSDNFVPPPNPIGFPIFFQ